MHADPDYPFGMNQSIVTDAPSGISSPGQSSHFADGCAGLAVAAVAASAIFWNLTGEPHFIDESAMIAQSYYYTLWKSGARDHVDWLHYAAYDHPPLPKYMFGMALDLAGLPVPTSIGPWMNWMRGDYSPPADPRVLFWSRVPAALFGVGGAVALYFVGLQVHSRVAGLIAAALLTLNPLYFTHARRAMSDSFTECLVLASVALALWGCRLDPLISRRWLAWCLFVLAESMCCGLAALAKLNGGIAAAIVLAIVLGNWLLAAATVRRSPIGRDLRTPPIAALAIGAGSFAVFVLLNPFMTARPSLAAGVTNKQTYELAAMNVLERARFLVRFRQEWTRDALANEHFQQDWLRTTKERARMTVWEGFGRYSPIGPRDIRNSDPRPETERFQDYGRARALVWLPFVGLGTVLALATGWRDFRRGTAPLPWAVVLYLVSSMAIVVGMIPLNWDRYYLPLQAPAALLASMGVAATILGWRSGENMSGVGQQYSRAIARDVDGRTTA
jgi:4-amino-4-deoxy-L-arabinose transferase-like glycosyltransferase